MIIGGLVFCFCFAMYAWLKAQDGSTYYEGGNWYTIQVNPTALASFLVLALFGVLLLVVGAVIYLGYREDDKHTAQKIRPGSYYQQPNIEGPRKLPVNYCPGCGRRVGPNASYCEGCGRQLE